MGERRRRQAKACQWKPAKVGGEAFVVACEAAETCAPGEGPFDDPAAWQEDETAFGFLEFVHFEADAWLGRHGGDLGPGIALVDEGKFDLLVGDGLELPGEFAHLRPFLLVGRGDFERQQAAQRIDRDVDLGTLAPLVPVVASTRATLRGGRHGAAVEDRRRRMARPALHRHPHHPAQRIEGVPQCMLARRASSRISVRYGAQNSHSSSLTSLGYPRVLWLIASDLPGGIQNVQHFHPKKCRTGSTIGRKSLIFAETSAERPRNFRSSYEAANLTSRRARRWCRVRRRSGRRVCSSCVRGGGGWCGWRRRASRPSVPCSGLSRRG